MKMVLAWLRMLILKVHITVPVIMIGVDSDETWMHGDWFYTTGYGIFGHEIKATKRSPPDNPTRWIITHSKGFTRKGLTRSAGL